MYQIEHYLSGGEHKDLYIDWLNRLRCSQAKAAVVLRVTRVELDNLAIQVLLCGGYERT